MKRALRSQLRLVSITLLSMILTGICLSTAHADPARDQCTAEARSRLSAFRAKITPEQRENAKAAGVALGFLVGGIFNAAREASQTDADVDRSIYRMHERNCLRNKGLDQLPAAPPPASTPASTGKAKSEGRSASAASHAGPSKSAGKCACPQMRECHGSWERLSCSQLKERCRNPSTPLGYVQNNCDKLKQLVGSF